MPEMPPDFEGDKRTTYQAYETAAQAIAEKFDGMGPERRLPDVKRGFSFVRKDNPRVVEVGVGSGRDAVQIVKLTDDFRGFDYSTELLKIARQKLPDAQLEQADLATYRFPKSVDIIFAFASLLHSNKDELTDFLSRAEAALNPGGILYVSMKEGPYRRQEHDDRWGYRVFYLYTSAEFRELAGPAFETVYKDHQRRNENWFTLALRKHE
jgi:predicted TPR repeat methyltransferase